MLKFVIGDLPVEPDQSVIPPVLRELPPVPANWKDLMANRMVFELERGAGGGETEWLINGQSFDPGQVVREQEEPRQQGATRATADGQLQRVGDPQRWWRLGAPDAPAHGRTPHHDAQRERRSQAPTKARPDGVGKEDVIGLDPGESVIIYRGFRDFVGPYVAHCHNLAHEDHAMMFGWEIT